MILDAYLFWQSIKLILKVTTMNGNITGVKKKSDSTFVVSLGPTKTGSYIVFSIVNKELYVSRRWEFYFEFHKFGVFWWEEMLVIIEFNELV